MKALIIPLLTTATLLLAPGCATSHHESHAVGAAVNRQCPMMDEAVDPAVTAMFEDQMVAFCCNDCVPEWNKLTPDEKRAALQKVDGREPAKGGDEHHTDKH